MKLKADKFLKLLSVLSIITISFVITPITFQNDTFYTIKIGEQIFYNGIDMMDHFSWHVDLPYTYPHWAYDLITYIIYNNYGFLGLYILTSLFSIILGYVLYYVNTKISKSYIISIIVTITTMILFKNFIAARAQLITFILFILTIFYIEKLLEEKKLWYAIALIIIPIIIANFHLAVWPFYFLLYVPYIAEYFAVIICERFNNKFKNLLEQKLILEKKKNIKFLIIIFLLASITGLLTPTGFEPYTYLVKTLQGTTVKSISEHAPLVLINKKEILFFIGVFASIFSFTNVKIKLCDFLMICGLLLLAIASNRQISMLLLIGSIIFTKLLKNFIESYPINTFQKKIEIIFRNKLIYFAVFLTILLLGNLIYSKQKNDKFISERLYPITASKWIKQNLELKDIKLFNEYNYGSYLLYEGIPVFIDSRADLYAPEFNRKKTKNGELYERNIFDDYINTVGLNIYYHEQFEKYKVTHIILYKNSKLNILLNNDDRYELLYFDEYFVIYKKQIN